MIFLNPIILWFLGAISIPIIIHIFNLRRTKKIEFPTLMFLKEIQQTKYKKIKLKQLLILLCRIGFITALVLAFANPISRGYLGWAGNKLRTTAILVIDDSFSMQAAEHGRTKLETAKEKIREIYTLFDDKDEVYFTTTSAAVLQRNIKPVYSEEQLNELIFSVQPTAIPADYNTVITKSLSIFENSNNPNKEIFILTDGQKNNLDIKTYPEKVKDIGLNFIITGNHTPANISIDTIDVKTKIFEKNKNVFIRCIVNNRNNFNVTGKTLTLNFLGKTADEKNIDIPSGTSIETEFNFEPNTTGYGSGYIELSSTNTSDDEIIYDNKRYFTIYVPASIKILIASSGKGKNFFLETVLNTVNEVFKDTINTSTSYFETEQTEIINDANLKGKRLLIINGKLNITKEEASAIEKFLSSGGGMIIYPSQDISTESYNIFLTSLGLPAISGLSTESQSNNISINEFNYEHPIIETIFKKKPDRNYYDNSPVIRHYFILQTGDMTKSIIRLNNGNNFLAENNYGKGKILTYAVAPDIWFSDFPENNLFTPLTLRSILYTSSSLTSTEQIAGKDYYIEIRRDTNQTSPVVLKNRLKNTEDDTIMVRQSKENFFLNLKNFINSASIYNLIIPDSEPVEFSANWDKRESDITLYNKNEIIDLYKDQISQVNILDITQDLTKILAGLRTGIELWRYFLILSILFIIAEYLLSKSLQKAPRNKENKI